MKDKQNFITTLDSLGPTRRAEIVGLLMPMIAPAVDSVKTKYRLHGKRFDRRAFFRICEGEHIEIANSGVFEFMAACEEVRGCLMYHPNGTRAIYLRSYWEKEICLSTAGHECGHHFLGHGGQKPTELLFRMHSGGRLSHEQMSKELQADLFAELLLQV